jgi:hypothetical protein
MNFERKLTLRTIGLTKGAIGKALPEKGAIALARFAGETSEAKTGQTDKGEFVRLIGQFFAVNLITGEQFTSSQAILPTFISEPLAAALRTSESVGFSIEISAEPDERSAVGYRFGVKALNETAPNDKVRRLMLAAGIKPEAAADADEAEAKPAKGSKAAKADPAA